MENVPENVPEHEFGARVGGGITNKPLYVHKNLAEIKWKPVPDTLACLPEAALVYSGRGKFFFTHIRATKESTASKILLRIKFHCVSVAFI
mgnify:CR=1 FL=1